MPVSGRALDCRHCRRPAAGPADDLRRPGGADGCRRQQRAQPVLSNRDRVDAAGDAGESRGHRDLPQYDQGRLHPWGELRQGRALRPQSRPLVDRAGARDDGRRQSRLPGRRAGGRHRAGLRDAPQPAGNPQRPEGHARCRCIDRGRPRGQTGQCRHRCAARRGDLFLRPQPRALSWRVARRLRPLGR